MASGEARGLVALPAGIRHRVGKQHPVAEDDLGVGWRSRISTGYSWEGNQRPKNLKRELKNVRSKKTAARRDRNRQSREKCFCETYLRASTTNKTLQITPQAPCFTARSVVGKVDEIPIPISLSF